MHAQCYNICKECFTDRCLATRQVEIFSGSLDQTHIASPFLKSQFDL
jgi:hypothetical protein